MASETLFPVNEDMIVDGLGVLTRFMNQQGITTVFDASTMELERDTVKRVLDRVAAQDQLTVRVFGASAVYSSDDTDTAVDQADGWRKTVVGDGFHYNALKIFNDGTVEGFRCTDVAAFGIQYHPEAGPGPHDSRYLFGRFAELIDRGGRP